MLDLHDIRRRLSDAYTVEYHPELGSTNDRARALAREGAPGNTVVVTDFQTAGRGRRGAVWTAPRDSSVLCSLLLRPSVAFPPHHLAILTGVGAVNGLQAFAPDAKIKWPNDIMLHDRKIAGILVETVDDAVIIGIGINCTVPTEAFPDDIRTRAGSLDAFCETAISRELVLASVVQGLSEAVTRVETGGIIKVLLQWNQSNWLSRRKVRVTSPMGSVDGDGLFLDGRRVVFHVFKDCGVVAMPLSSSVEAR